jgi:PRC-barrel domain protein
MLLRVGELQDYKILAKNGEIGHVEQLYFDDQTWAVKYIVVDIGNWLSGRTVLISPTAIIEANPGGKNIHTALTREQIEDGPATYTHKPVASQHPTDYSVYLGWPSYYWGLTGLEDTAFKEENDPHLRSTKVVGRYHIMALDGEIGHIEDFIVDDQTWTIRYAVADTRNWWPGKKVLLATEWILFVSWAESNAYVSLQRDRIIDAPEFDPTQPLTRDYEIKLYAHYKQSPYWEQKGGGQKETHST